MIIDLFKQCIWESTFYSELKEYSYNVEKNNESVSKSNQGGFQSDFLDQSQDIIKPLISHIQHETHRYSKEVFNMDQHYTVGSMWLNINRHKDYNHTHTHPHCQWSGVYYISVPKNSGMLEFNNPYQDGMESHWNNSGPVGSFNTINACRMRVVPQQYKMFIFPSYYKHSVNPNNSNKDRISISFNLS